jgi:hypothetical protein
MPTIKKSFFPTKTSQMGMTGGAGNKIILMSKNNEELPPPIE